MAVLLPLLFLTLAAGAVADPLRGNDLPYPRALAIELGPLEREIPVPAVRRSTAPAAAEAIPLQIGSGRTLARLQTPEDLAGELLWQELPGGGRVAMIRLESSGAQGVRLALEAEQVPDAAEFRFFDREGRALRLVTGARINRLVALNLLSGAPQHEARIYWSPLLAGDFIGLEIYLPPEVAPDQLVMALPTLSHLFAPLEPVAELKQGTGAAADCHLDVNCFPEWEMEKNAVAVLFYNIGADTFQCSGTLLNDRDNSNSLYFLTVRHCIDDQLKASSVETFWFWYSTACGGGPPSFDFLGHLDSGAQLLRSHAATDMSLLELSGSPPSGVTFAGWSVAWSFAPPQLGDLAAGLHHPQSDLQKFASGLLRGHFNNCRIEGSSLICNEADGATGTFVDVNFTRGIVEFGSSGSGLFAEIGGYVLGTLSASRATCANPAETNFYGRFDRAFIGAPFWPWLDPDQRYAAGLLQVEARQFASNGDPPEPAPAPPPVFPPAPAPTPEPAPAPTGGGGGCFIATAAYGSAEAPQVLLLRRFRDQVLLRSDSGRRLVAFYYLHSPAGAQWLTERPGARALVRAALVPTVALARLALALVEALESDSEELKISLADSSGFC